MCLCVHYVCDACDLLPSVSCPAPHHTPSPHQTALLNKHLGELMPKLSAKVFRTFNASKTLQDQLDELTVGEHNACLTQLAFSLVLVFIGWIFPLL